MTDRDDATGKAGAVRAGGCAAWELGLDEVLVARTRRLVGSVATGLRLPDGLAGDLVLGASELAANVWLHGGGPVVVEDGRPVAGLPEVWVYARGTAPRELVVTVFDTGEWAETTTDVPAIGVPDPEAEHGRGLQIVAGLAAGAGGRWGRHLSRSRLGRCRVPGTASWLALPLPAGVLMDPRGRPPSPADAIEQLAGHLTTRGAGAGLIRGSNRVEALLSCPAGLTVWARYGAYRWEDANGLRQCPYADVVDAAEHLLAVMAPPPRR